MLSAKLTASYPVRLRRLPTVIRAGLQVVGPRLGNKTVSSAFILLTNTPQYGDNGILVLGDCGVIPDPTAEQLADIACICVERAERTVQMLRPRVAFLSYSTMGSGAGESVDKVRQAVQILKDRGVEFEFDGEMQADAALVPEVGERKAPGSKVAGHANVLIFPNLDAANIGYKMVQRFANATALGPLVQGLAKPILDLSRGCSTEDVVDVVAVCCSDAITTDIMKKTGRSSLRRLRATGCAVCSGVHKNSAYDTVCAVFISSSMQLFYFGLLPGLSA